MKSRLRIVYNDYSIRVNTINTRIREYKQLLSVIIAANIIAVTTINSRKLILKYILSRLKPVYL